MQVVPSTYHKCLKFPFNDHEFTIVGDSNPFQYCNIVKPAKEGIVLHNREASSSSSPPKEGSFASTLANIKKKLQFKDK